MKFQSSSIFVLTIALLLGSCASSGDQTITPEPSAVSSAAPESPTASNAASDGAESADHSAPKQGGQVVETDKYHLELVAVPEGSGTHLDLFLQTGDTHEPVEGATVKAQVQLPDGSQEEISLDYDEEGKHYAALLPAIASGEYKVVILTDINGEKVNGRFSFNK